MAEYEPIKATIEVEADTSEAEKNLKKLKDTGKETFEEIAESEKKTSETSEKVKDSLGGLKEIFEKLAEKANNVGGVVDFSNSIQQADILQAKIVGIADRIGKQVEKGDYLGISRSVEGIQKAIDKLTELDKEAEAAQKKIAELADENGEIKNETPKVDKQVDVTAADVDSFIESRNEVDRLSDSLDALRQKYADAVNSNEAEEKLLRIESRIVSLREKLEELTKPIQEVTISADAMGRISSMVDEAFPQIKFDMGDLEGLLNSRTEIDRLTDSLQLLKEEYVELANAGGDSKKLLSLEERIASLTKKIEELSNETPKVKGMFDSIMNESFIKGAFSKAGKDISNVFRNITSYAKRAAGEIKKFGASIAQNLGSKLTEGVRKVEQLVNSFGRILMYRAVRSAIKEITASVKEGYENLYRWSRLNDGEFSTSMDRLATEALHVKNALGAALAPVINALVPIVEKLSHAFIEVVNGVNQFLSALTGASTWTMALHTPITYAQAAGKGFDKATKKAKKYKATILGFDEINKLNDNTSSLNGDTSGSDELPYGSMFTKKPLSDFWKKWLDTNDWTDLGRLAAQRANKILKDLDKWILTVARPWALKWSERIATFLNGFVEKFDWEFLGKTIADGMMVIVDSVNLFFEKFNAKAFGNKIASTIKGWFENIEWSAIGRYFANGINFVADTASGFFAEFVRNAEEYGGDLAVAFRSWVNSIHWDEIRNAISDGLRSIAGVIRGFVRNEDGSWDRFRTEFVQTINTVIGSPDIDELIDAGTDLINNIVRMLGDVDWEGVGRKIGLMLGGIDWMSVLVTTAEAVVKGLWGAIQGVLESDNGGSFVGAMAIVTAVTGAFSLAGTFASGIVGGFTAELGKTLMNGLVSAVGSEGLGAAVLGSMGWIAGIGALIAEVGVFVYEGVTLWNAHQDLMQAKANETSSVLRLQAALAENGINASTEQIEAHLNGLISVSELTGGKFQSFGEIVSSSTGRMSANVTGDLDSVAKTASATFDKVSKSTVDFTGGVNDVITRYLTEASDGSSDSMRKLADDTTNIFRDVSSAVGDINQALSNSFSKMASSISESMQRMYNSVSSNMTRIASNVEQNARRIQEAFNSVSSAASMNVSIPAHANGGMVEDGLFFANSSEIIGQFSNGNSYVANNEMIIEALEQGVYNAVSNALANQSSGGGDTILMIDSEEIARASIKGQRKLDRRISPTVKFSQ